MRQTCSPAEICCTAAAVAVSTLLPTSATSSSEHVMINHYRYQVIQSTYLAAAVTPGSTASFASARFYSVFYALFCFLHIVILDVTAMSHCHDFRPLNFYLWLSIFSLFKRCWTQ